MPAPFRAVVGRKREAVQGAEATGAHQDDTAAITAVAAGRATPRHELLAPERQAAVTARTREDIDDGLVDEVHQPLPRDGPTEPPAASQAPWPGSNS